MPNVRMGRLGRGLLLGATVAIVGMSVPSLGLGDAPFVAAGVARANDNGDRGTGNRGNDDDEDHVLNGQVLEINTLKDPPEMLVGTGDGQVVVKVYKTDEIAVNGINTGDYISAQGEKVHELLFEAQKLEVAERYSGSGGSDKKKKR